MSTERIDIVVTERGSRTARRNIEDIGKGASAAQGAVSLLNRTLGLIGLGLGFDSLFRLSDAATTAHNRLAVLGGGAEQTQKQLGLLNQIANNSGQSIESLVGLFQKGAIAAKDLAASEQNLFKFIKTVSDSLRIQGSSAEQSQGALLQLSQALSTGIIRAEEFNSVMENAYPIALAAARGVTRAAGSVGQLRLMIIKGQVTSKEFFEAVISQYDRMGEEALRANLTIGQSFAILRNKLIQFSGALNNATGLNKLISDAILLVASNIDKLAIALVALGGITVFNLLTAQVLTFGSTVSGVLGFITLGFIQLGSVLTSAVLKPFSLLGVGLTSFAKSAVFVGSGLVGMISSLSTAGGFLAKFVSQLTVLTLLTAKGGFTYLLTLGLTSAKTAFLGLLNPTKTLVSLFGILRTSLLFLSGSFVLIAGGALLFVLLKDKVADALNKFIDFGTIVPRALAAIKEGTQTLLAVFVATYKTVISTWEKFPAALGDIVIRGVNSAMRALHGFGDDVIALFNKIFNANIAPLDPFKGFENKFKGSASDIAGVFNEEFNKALSVNQLDAMKQKFTDFTAFLKSAVPGTLSIAQLKDEIAKLATDALGGGVIPAVPVGTTGGAAESRRRTFKDHLMELQNDLALTRMSNMEREKQEKLFDIEEKLRRKLTDAEKAQVNSLLDLVQAQKDENDLLTEIQGPQEEFIRKTDTLNRLLEKGKINLGQFTDKLRQLRIASLESGRDLGSGLERGLLKIQEEFGNVATVAESAMTNSMKSIEDAFVEMSMTGKFQFKDLVNTIHAEITRLAVRQSIIKPLSDMIGNNAGGIGGFLSGLLSPNGQSGLGSMMGGLGSLFGFENGGDFTVGGNNNSPDGQLVMFKATKGESVSVRPKGTAHGDRPINITYNISTPDANSFTRSQGQILAKTQAALSRANGRNN